MVSTGRLRLSAGQSRSSSERYELGSVPKDDMQDLYGLGSQDELLLLRRMATEEIWEECEVVVDVLLSVRARASEDCHPEVGDALRSAEYAEVGVYV